MRKAKSKHELGVTFVSATRESSGARTPEGGKRWLPGESFIAALDQMAFRRHRS